MESKVHVKYRRIHGSDLEYDDKFLERGTYGDVKKAKWLGKDVAVKMFSCSEKKGGFSEELVCLSMLHEHPHIVDLHGAHLGDSMSDRPFLVLEFAPHSLEKVLHLCRKELKYTVDHVMSWTLQMSIALEFIHSKDMLHRDIKPSNILLFKEGRELKLCDFGTARKLQHTLTNAVGTAWYMAPEVIRGTYYTPSCDVYSFGVVLWEMITRHKPYLAGTKGKNLAPQSVIYKVANGGRPPMICRLPKCLEELISRCWDEASHKRPTTMEIKTKVERLTEIARIEKGKPFIRKRRQKKVEPESQGDLFAQEGRNTQEKSPIAQKPPEGDIMAVKQSPQASSSPPPPDSSSPPPSSPTPPPPDTPQTPSSSPASSAVPPPTSSTPPLPPPSSTSTPLPPHQLPITSEASEEQRTRESRAQTYSAGSGSVPRQLYTQQSSPALRPPPVIEPDPFSSYPRGALSPYLQQRRNRSDQQSPNTSTLQTSGASLVPAFSPQRPISHQDSNVSVASTYIEREEEEESQYGQMQQWYQRVEEEVKSGGLETTDSQVPRVFPRASYGTSPYAIPGLEEEWQPIIPDPSNPESMQCYQDYKETAQQVIRAKQDIINLTELNAQVDREISGDESKLGQNVSARQQYQALLNQKDSLVRELQSLQKQLEAVAVKNA